MSARDALLAYLRQAGLSTPRAEANLDAFAHELAEEIRQRYGQPRWEGDEPEYAYGYNAATHDAADRIDPHVSAAPVRPDDEPTA